MTNKSITKLLFFTCVIFVSSMTCADVKLEAIFGDHMVLQQKEKVAIWGWADPGEKVTVKGSWPWSKKTTKANKNGEWKVKIKTPKAGGPYTLTITGNNEIVINDILMGEVWVCSGQSNMEWHMNMPGTNTGANDIASANHPNIRLFTVKQVFSAKPLDDVEGNWEVCTPQTVASFSAVAYCYGVKLNETLDVPVGLISTNWGGTEAEEWTSKETLSHFEQFKSKLEILNKPARSLKEINKEYQKNLKVWLKSLVEIDTGLQEKCHKIAFDDSNWKEMELPIPWSKTDLVTVDGIVWFRREFNLPQEWANQDMQVHLGVIDALDTLWINGVMIGTTNSWDKPRVYNVPASALRAGKNSIVVRVIDNQGEGGFLGNNYDMRIGRVNADKKHIVPLAGKWKYKICYRGKAPAAPTNLSDINQYTVTTLYNAMIKPLIPYRIAGVIWYQGESNCYRPIEYRTLFPAMIKDWRDHWNQGNFPFYYVQIAPFRYNVGTNSQALREAQMMTLGKVKNIGMAVTMDIGQEYDIHPHNKIDVGNRLARWALAKTYKQKGIVYSGPIYKKMKVKNSKVCISFDYVNDGLTAKDGKLTDFMIAGADQKFVPAEAVICGDKVVVSSDQVKEPVAVRYGWSDWVSGSLFNKAGLPASSFRTDDWPIK